MVQESHVMEKVIVICGPTGVGKTNLSIKLAQYFNGEILNADASQVFEELHIGTAKATKEEMKEVPHHLFSFKQIEAGFSIKEYQRLSRKTIDEITKRHNLPILVGGSGLYINACIYNYELESTKRLEEFENKYDEVSNEDLYQELIKHVPSLKEKLHPNNRRRILRLLSQVHLDNKTSFQEEKKMVYDCLILFLHMDRTVLYERINLRTNLMLEAGWMQEVEMLRKKNVDFNKIQSIGYKELNSVLEEEIPLKDAIEIIQQKTRRYAKRQITWFKNQLPTIPIEVDLKNLQTTYAELKQTIETFLNT